MNASSSDRPGGDPMPTIVRDGRPARAGTAVLGAAAGMIVAGVIVAARQGPALVAETITAD